MAHNTQASGSQQQCADEAVAQPEIKNTQIKHAGAAGSQEMYATVVNQPLDCGDAVGITRIERFKFRVQDALHRSRWITFLQPGFNLLLKSNDQGSPVAHLTAGIVGNNKNRGLYECTRGPETTGAEFDLKVIAKDDQTRQSLATRIYKTAIQKIFPKRC
jgi:hypothetical protein